MPSLFALIQPVRSCSRCSRPRMSRNPYTVYLYSIFVPSTLRRRSESEQEALADDMFLRLNYAPITKEILPARRTPSPLKPMSTASTWEHPMSTESKVSTTPLAASPARWGFRPYRVCEINNRDSEFVEYAATRYHGCSQKNHTNSGLINVSHCFLWFLCENYPVEHKPENRT